MSHINISASAVHQALKTKLVNLLKEYSTKNNLNQIEILAVAAQIVGMIITFQDQRIFNPEQITDIINKNIKEGNEAALLQLNTPKGHA